jgi:hypothetical protein
MTDDLKKLTAKTAKLTEAHRSNGGEAFSEREREIAARLSLNLF